MLMGAFMSVSGVALSAAKIRPILELAEPFLRTEPETTEGKEIVTRLAGGIELNRVSFRYADDAPYILNDLSLKIRPGETSRWSAGQAAANPPSYGCFWDLRSPKKEPSSMMGRTSKVSTYPPSGGRSGPWRRTPDCFRGISSRIS